MTNPAQQPIGWTDESDPCGQGYQIMTENGLETYDLSEHEEYMKAVERVKHFKERVKL